jgi:HSP20 family protein
LRLGGRAAPAATLAVLPKTKEANMKVKDLIPHRKDRSTAVTRYAEERNPFLAFHREMNRLFDDFFHGFDTPLDTRFGWSGVWPSVDVSENEKEVRVVAEVPGLDEKDIEVTLSDGVLTLRGEKQHESQDAVYSERWHGGFERSLDLGSDVDPDKVNASFKNGVLTITVAKRADAQSRVKRIPIHA